MEGKTEHLLATSEFGAAVLIVENIVPNAIPSEGYMLDYWIDQYGNTFGRNRSAFVVRNDFLFHNMISDDRVFAAVFTEDLNGDNIPDYIQTLHNVSFVAGRSGSIVGKTEHLVDGQNGGWISLGQSAPEIKTMVFKAEAGYTFDYLIDPYGEQLDLDQIWYSLFQINEDTVFVAIFAEDQNNNGIPDYKEI